MGKKRKSHDDDVETEYEDPNIMITPSVSRSSRSLRSTPARSGGTGKTKAKIKNQGEENYELKKRIDQLESDNANRESFTIEYKKRKRKEEKFQVRRALDSVMTEDINEDLMTTTNEEIEPLYYRCNAKPSMFPSRKFCSVCGKISKYTCPNCSLKYCSIKCNNDHKETRCQKFVQ
eukprot:gene8501-325_t